MCMSDSNTGTINETELGTGVLTLTEALQTFEVESNLFHITQSSERGKRAVILKKKKVEIDG